MNYKEFKKAVNVAKRVAVYVQITEDSYTFLDITKTAVRKMYNNDCENKLFVALLFGDILFIG